MNYIFTFPYDASKYTVVENELQLAFPDSENIKTGNEITRIGKMNLDPAKIKEKHPYSNKIKENNQNYILVNGSIVVTYEWVEEDNIQENDVDAFIQYLEESPETWVCEKDMEDNKLITQITFAGENTEWCSFPLGYMLDCANLSIVATSDDAEILCIMQKNATLKWNMSHIDVAPNETIDVVRPDCEVAYVVTSQDAVIETTMLGTTNDGHTVPFDKFSVKKLESQSVKLKNISDKANKIIIYYK